MGLMTFADFLRKKEEEGIEANIIFIKKVEVPIERENVLKTTFSEKTVVYTYAVPMWNMFTAVEISEIVNLYNTIDGENFKIKEFIAKRKGEDNIEYFVKFEKIRGKRLEELVSKVL
jgi:hypothetical protein